MRKVITILLVLCTLVIFSEQRTNAQLSESKNPDSESMHLDAAHYAEDYKIDIEEADRRLRNQPAIDALFAQAESLLGDSFGGAWVEHKNYGVFVASTDSIRLNEIDVPSILRDDVRLIEVQETYDELLDASQGAYRTLTDADPQLADIISHVAIPSTRTIHVFVASLPSGDERSLTYSTTEGESPLDELSSILDLPTRLAGDLELLPGELVVHVSSIDTREPEARAGATLTTCTQGYNIRNPSGLRRKTTAGHCDDVQSVNGTNLPFVTEWDRTGNMDVQYHNRNGLPTPGTAIDNNPNDSTPNYRIITGETTRPFMYGDYVCKFGRTTGYTCGIVLSTAHDIGSCCNATWMYVGSDNGIDLSQPGDSGAPWYSGSIAYGMHFNSAGSGGRDAIFWGIEFLPNDFDVITG